MWTSASSSCTCFHVPDVRDDESPIVTPHPLIPNVWHLQFDHAEALVIDGKLLLTCPEYDSVCPTHGVPPLARPTYADRLALRAFYVSQGIEYSIPPEPTDLEGVYPLFAALTRQGEVLLSSEPHRGLQLVGAISLPYLYVRGAGGFPIADRDSVELHVMQHLSGAASWTNTKILQK